jgi:hypothetical protein
MPQAMGNVGRERRCDAQAEEPARQRASAGTGVLRRAESSMTIELA